MLIALGLSLVCGLTALDVYLTLRILDIADLTVDSSFTADAAVAAMMITAGQDPWLAILGDLLADYTVGTVADLLHVNAGIHPLFAGVPTQIDLYSVNLHILSKADIPLFHGIETLLTPLCDKGPPGSQISTLIFAALITIVTTLFDWLFSTQIGPGMRSTNDNEGMARAQGVSTGTMKITGLTLSSGLVASSGAIVVQYQGYTDIPMGIGLIVAGLVSVIIGTALIGSQGVWVTSLFVVIEPIMYRVIIQLAPGVEFFEANGMRLISTVIVFAALMIPRIDIFSKIRECRHNRSLVPGPDTTYTPEERDNEKVVFQYWASGS